MPDFELPRFDLGKTVATPGALSTLTEAYGPATGTLMLRRLLKRHQCGDWGDLKDPEDERANEQALRDGDRLLSAYNLSKGERIWIITEWDRSYTTVLLPDEY